MNRVAPSPVDIVARLRELAERGSPSDRRIAAAVLADPGFATHAAIARLAERAEVSEPTVTRFCRRLGCDGLRDFKVRLAQAIATSGRYLADTRHDRLMGASVPEAVEVDACEAITLVCRATDAGALERAGEMVASARSVLAYGSGGGSALAATELQTRLFRLGLPTSSHADGEMQRMTAAAADGQTVVVAYSVSGEVRGLVDAVRVARLYGARTLAVTAPDSPLAEAAELVLSFRVEEHATVLQPSASRYALLALTDMLATTVAKRIGAPAVERMRRIKHHQSLSRPSPHGLPIGD